MAQISCGSQWGWQVVSALFCPGIKKNVPYLCMVHAGEAIQHVVVSGFGSLCPGIKKNAPYFVYGACWRSCIA